MPRIIMALGMLLIFLKTDRKYQTYIHCSAIMIIINGDVNANYMLFSEQLFCVKYNFF